jgi:hypothetical protein
MSDEGMVDEDVVVEKKERRRWKMDMHYRR